MSLRPSSLPKIAACAKYESQQDAGAAAARGTRLDSIFRDLLAGKDPAEQFENAEEAEGIAWACKLVEMLSYGNPIVSSEDALRIEAVGMTGTADVACPNMAWSGDLKTGQKRNYREQQAAYALGFMDLNFCDEWTVYLFYCDLRDYEIMRFTHDEANDIVRGVVARRLDDNAVATPCDYCSWCANAQTCEPRLALASPLIDPLKGDAAFHLVLEDDEKLGRFLRACKTVADLDETAREVAKARLIASGGERKIPFCHVSSRKGRNLLPATALAPLVEKLGAERVLSLYGAISLDNAKPLFEEAAVEVPTDAIIETPGTVSLTVRSK